MHPDFEEFMANPGFKTPSIGFRKADSMPTVVDKCLAVDNASTIWSNTNLTISTNPQSNDSSELKFNIFKNGKDVNTNISSEINTKRNMHQHLVNNKISGEEYSNKKQKEVSKDDINSMLSDRKNCFEEKKDEEMDVILPSEFERKEEDRHLGLEQDERLQFKSDIEQKQNSEEMKCEDHLEQLKMIQPIHYYSESNVHGVDGILELPNLIEGWQITSSEQLREEFNEITEKDENSASEDQVKLLCDQEFQHTLKHSIGGDQEWTSELKECEEDACENKNLTVAKTTGVSSCLHSPAACCCIISGHETVIEIKKGKQALGLDVVGGANTLLGVILIREIYENGAAANDGRLAIGDQILEVNGESFSCITEEFANEFLRQTPSVVQMVIYREEVPFSEDEIYDIFNVDLIKRLGKGLGISIIGRDKNNGIFISDVIKGSTADLDGHLMPGDHILVINGVDARHLSQQTAAEMLKTLIGRVSLTVGRVKFLSRSTSRSSSITNEVEE